MRGFSTIEMLLALSILAGTVVAITLTSIGLPLVLASGSAYEEAVDIIFENLQREEMLSETRFDLVASIASTTVNGYEQSVAVELLSDNLTKRLNSSVSWTDGLGQHTTSMSTLVSDFEHAGEQFCNPLPSGNWKEPILETYPLPATSSLSVLEANRSLLFAGASRTAHAGDPDLFLFDITDPRSPRLRGTLSTSSTTAGIAAFAVSEDILYIGSASACAVAQNCGQLQIIDIRDPEHPVVTGRLLLTAADQTVSTQSIAYRDGIVYLGLTKTPGAPEDPSRYPEFNVIDVHDPKHPKPLGSYRVGRTINAIKLQGDYAYLATDDRVHGDVLALDIQDPAAITKVATYSLPPSSNTSAGFAQSLAMAGSKLYVGRTSISNGNEFVAFDTGSTSALPIFSIELGSGLISLISRMRLMFSLTTNELDIWDMNDPANPERYVSIPLADSEIGKAMACSGNTIYVSSNTNDGAGMLTIISPS